MNKPAAFMPELLHSVAFAPRSAAGADAEGGLSQPVFCTAADVARLTASDVVAFVKRRVSGGNVLAVACAVPHEQLRRLAASRFGALPRASVTHNQSPVQYSGGVEVLLQTAAEADDVTHVAFGLRGASVDSVDTDDDLYLSCLLQQLLGGGDSFSTGGPGKGMHSLLYR
jgi:processing peptidase subunit alpha